MKLEYHEHHNPGDDHPTKSGLVFWAYDHEGNEEWVTRAEYVRRLSVLRDERNRTPVNAISTRFIPQPASPSRQVADAVDFFDRAKNQADYEDLKDFFPRTGDE